MHVKFTIFKRAIVNVDLEYAQFFNPLTSETLVHNKIS